MRYLSFVIIFLLAGCVSNRSVSPEQAALQFCPAFANAEWEPMTQLITDLQSLIDKQKFAVKENDQTHWFKGNKNYLGLCIVPVRTSRATVPGCNTAYATYKKKDNHWKLMEQKVTICPG